MPLDTCHLTQKYDIKVKKKTMILKIGFLKTGKMTQTKWGRTSAM